MKRCTFFLLLLCISAALKAQTDTVAGKINKLPHIKVDALAKFPGGDFSKYIAGNIDYEKKVDRNIHGVIVVSMKIDTTGNVADVNILQSMSADIDREVVHVIKSSPRWKPAMRNGRPIAVYMVFNIDMGIRGTPTSPSPNPPVNNTAIISKPASATAKNKPPVENKPLPNAKNTTLAILSKPSLKAIKKQVPPFDKKPVAVVQKKPAQLIVVKKPVPQLAKAKPQVIKKSTPPVVVKKPAPQVAKVKPPVVKKPIPPIVVKKPVPQVTKIAPPVVKKPAPPVMVKKPVPQVAKVTPPVVKKPAPTVIVKKPVPQVAKIMPPVVKKPTPPVIVKKPVPQVAKVTPPVVKKPVPPVVIKKPVPQIAKVTPPVVKKPIAPVVKVAPTPLQKKPVVAITKKKPVKSKNKKSDDADLPLGRSANAIFPGGGQPAFYQYLSENIHYPILSKINKIEGVVEVSFIVDKDGTVTDVKVLNAPAEDLAEEAIRVLTASPKWTPAMQNGLAVKEPFTEHINFKLTDKQKQP